MSYTDAKIEDDCYCDNCRNRNKPKSLPSQQIEESLERFKEEFVRDNEVLLPEDGNPDKLEAFLKQELKACMESEHLKHCECEFSIPKEGEVQRVIELCKLHGDLIESAMKEGFNEAKSRILLIDDLAEAKKVIKSELAQPKEHKSIKV